MTTSGATRRDAIAMAAGWLAATAAPARAQRFPTRRLSMIVPSGPGGTTDALARVVAQFLQANLGEPVVIENVAGAGGAIGTQRTAAAAPDGYAIGFGNVGTLLIAPTLAQGNTIDPVAALAPIGLVGHVPMMLAASTRSNITSIAALIERARRDPGQLTLGVSGVGSSTHVFAELFVRRAGITVEIVPYRSGGQSINDIMAGSIDLIFELTPILGPAHTGGRVTALALGGEARSPRLSEVPTFSEAGIADYLGTAWYATVAPAAAPQAARERLEAGINEILDDRDYLARLEQMSVAPPGRQERGASYLRTLMRSDAQRWTAFVREAGIRAE